MYYLLMKWMTCFYLDEFSMVSVSVYDYMLDETYSKS